MLRIFCVGQHGAVARAVADVLCHHLAVRKRQRSGLDTVFDHRRRSRHRFGPDIQHRRQVDEAPGAVRVVFQQCHCIFGAVPIQVAVGDGPRKQTHSWLARAPLLGVGVHTVRECDRLVIEDAFVAQVAECGSQLSCAPAKAPSPSSAMISPGAGAKTSVPPSAKRSMWRLPSWKE